MVNRIAICDDVEVERFVLKRQLMVYFQTNGREAQIQEYESGESLLADIEEGYIWPDLNLYGRSEWNGHGTEAA